MSEIFPDLIITWLPLVAMFVLLGWYRVSKKLFLLGLLCVFSILVWDLYQHSQYLERVEGSIMRSPKTPSMSGVALMSLARSVVLGIIGYSMGAFAAMATNQKR